MTMKQRQVLKSTGSYNRCQKNFQTFAATIIKDEKFERNIKTINKSAERWEIKINISLMPISVFVSLISLLAKDNSSFFVNDATLAELKFDSRHNSIQQKYFEYQLM